MMQPLKGSFVALVTPMSPDGSLDFNALEALVEWHVEAGTNGIVSVGTTGEATTLTLKEHLKVVESTVNFVNGRIPVIAGSGSNSTSQAMETTSESKKLGADYCLLVTPYYNKPNQEGLIQHYMKIADAVDIPQILYNAPSRTACDIKPETVLRLANHQNIVGIKEALDNSERLIELISISQNIKDKKHFSVLSGDDPSFNSFMANGGDGVISVAANIIPNQIFQICSFNLAKKFDDAKELDSIFKNLYELLFIESNPMPVKWMLYKMGRIQSGIRLPLIPFNKDFHEKTINEMVKLNLI